MTDALKPCPFCGGTRLSDECTGAAEISGNTYQTGWIECFDCGCDGPSVDLTDETPAQNDYQLVRDAWNSRAAIAAPPVAPGWVLVPVEPTPEMDAAAFDCCEVDGKANGFTNGTEARRAIYRAMLSAAPGAPDAPPVVPARVPLTDAQIDAGIEAWFSTDITTNYGKDQGHPFRQRMRAAIEAAHGITADGPSGRDWSLLEATQESLREHMAEIQRLRAAVAAERERCAVLVEDTQRQWPGEGLDGHLLAAEIRAAA